MARTVFEHPIRELHGAFTKGGAITRRKTYRDSKGHVKGMSEHETYKIEHHATGKRNRLRERNWSINFVSSKPAQKPTASCFHPNRWRMLLPTPLTIPMARQRLPPKNWLRSNTGRTASKPNWTNPNPMHPSIPKQANASNTSASMPSSAHASCAKWNNLLPYSK